MKDHSPAQESKIRLILMSLLLSLVTWISLSGRSDDATQVQVFPQIALFHQNVPADMNLKTDNYQISVALKGSPKVLATINPSSDIQVRLDLSGYSEGEWTMPLTKQDVVISGDRNLEVENIIPDTVRLQLERVASRQVRLIMGTVGNPAKNFELKEVVLQPSEVTVTGPAARIANMSYLEAEPINIQEATKSLTGRIILNSADIPPDVVIGQLGKLHYRIRIEEKKISKQFKDPLAVQQAEPFVDNIVLNPAEVKLEIYGPVSAVEWFQSSWVIPELLISEFIDDEPLTQTEGEGTTPPPTVEPPSTKQMVPISYRWQIPEEIQQSTSDWASKISKLQLKWIPGQVEVEKQ